MERNHRSVTTSLKEGASFRKGNLVCRILKVNNVLQAIRYKVEVIKLETEGSISRYVQYVGPDYFHACCQPIDEEEFQGISGAIGECAKAIVGGANEESADI